MPPSLRIFARAKVNLFLEILNRRPDGYHTLSTVFQEISLADEVRVRAARRKPGEDASVALKVRGADLAAGPDNLAVRAARLFQTKLPSAPNFAVDLKKNIPIGAGLGGGSSDA